jgi:hypothetical protein
LFGREQEFVMSCYDWLHFSFRGFSKNLLMLKLGDLTFSKSYLYSFFLSNDNFYNEKTPLFFIKSTSIAIYLDLFMVSLLKKADLWIECLILDTYSAAGEVYLNLDDRNGS